MLNDTIAAISTPIGEAGIGVVRLSGARSLEILQAIFARKRGKNEIKPWHVHYGYITDPKSGQIIDEVLAVYMAAPHTYTREDVVEISCHGGMMPLQSILTLALQQGARLAHPGEFTMRAFINGRIDLAQAESVLDVVKAKTQAGLRIAMNQLDGSLSREIKETRAKIIDILAYLTATIDFAEDEIPQEDIAEPLADCIARVQGLLRHADAGIIYRQGLRTAIIGRPNVGKSSLMNALLRDNRAIVTPVPGTTRDTLEEVVNIRGVPIVLIDTAGITDTRDLVEQIGVERSRRAIETADLVLFVVDGSEPIQEKDREIAAALVERVKLVIVNKCDLAERIDDGELSQITGGAPKVRASALTGTGLSDIEEAISTLVLGGAAVASDALLVSNPRHKAALEQALSHLQVAAESYRNGMPADFIAIDTNAAADALGEITGETVTEDLLENIFGRFCIGK